MKVLMTADTVGGVWTYSVQLARALQPYHVEIALAVMGGPLSESQQEQIAELSHVTLYPSNFQLEWMEDPWEDLRAASLWLLRIADEFRPDIVHLNNFAHGTLAWECPVLIVGHSCVCSWHECVRNKPAGPEWDRYRRQVTDALRTANVVVAPTAAMLQRLSNQYGLVSETRVISNGIDYPPPPETVKDPIILSAGRVWDEAKNIGLLGEIADQLDWPVLVAGDTHHPNGRDLNLFSGVFFLGKVPHSQMRTWYGQASIYALPAKYEPFGLTALEAALCGCPLVLGDIDSLREVWGVDALFVAPDDRQGWIDTLNRLSNDESLRKHYAHRAMKRARTLTSTRMATQYYRLYSRLLGKPTSSFLDWLRGAI